MKDLFGEMLNLPAGLRVTSQATGTGDAAFFMMIINGMLAVFFAILWYVYDLHSTELYMIEYLTGIQETHLPVWLVWLITNVLIWIAMFLPSVLQWAIAHPGIREHAAFGWLFAASIAFDFVTDAPLVVAHTDRFIVPRMAFITEPVVLDIITWLLYGVLTVLTSVALQTICVSFAYGTWAAFIKRGYTSGTTTPAR
jgi:hypothetical protein